MRRSPNLHFLFGLWSLLALVLFKDAAASPADTILFNGTIVRFDAPPASALAIRGESIVCVGTDECLQPLIGHNTLVVDLGGRTVIPGLIDSHIHAIRAGLTWRTEISWIGVRSLKAALQRVRERAASVGSSDWLVVAGGWTPSQFAEDRGPTASELEEATAGHPAFVQLLYSKILLNSAGVELLGMDSAGVSASRLRFETDANGRQTGWLVGGARAISDVFDRIPRPGHDESVAGTKALFRELNKLGLTGVVDPGGYNLPLKDYQALFSIWRQGQMTLRVRYSVSAPRPNSELSDFKALTALMPMGFGDEWLRFNGIGENVTWGMYNNEMPSQEDRDHLAEVLRWASASGLAASFHWNNDRSVRHLLEVIEQINAKTPVLSLRWSIAHLHDLSVPNMKRMRTLGLGWLMQNAFYFRGQAYLSTRGSDDVHEVPPIASAMSMGLPVGAGTDAHRVMWISPFVALQWMLDGKTIEGTAMRSPNQSPSRIEALRLFSAGSAWFTFDESRRGSMAVGQLADLAVLNGDYLTMPIDQIGEIRSLMTLVGGRVVYASGPFERLESTSP